MLDGSFLLSVWYVVDVHMLRCCSETVCVANSDKLVNQMSFSVIVLSQTCYVED